MYLTEKHIIKQSHVHYNECKQLCFLSKNLYNAGLYAVRQYYFQHKKFLNYIQLNNLFVTTKNVDYYALPAKVSQQTLKLVEQNFKSFFNLLKIKNKKEYDKKINIPNYKEKLGKQVVNYTIQSINLKELKKGIIKLSKTEIRIKTKIKDYKDVQQSRIIPVGNHYVIEIVYKYKEKDLKENNKIYASIDLGVNNLATITCNDLSIIPIVINGKPLKSMNQYYNKKLGKAKSSLPHYTNKNGDIVQKGKSNRTIRITQKRNNKINDYLHKSTNYIINHIVTNKINTLIVGYNKGWKQEIDNGKENNQNFVQIPLLRLVEMLKYKCEKVGINFIINEESYTSQSSFIDMDDIPVYKRGCNSDYKFSGYRPKRGIYKRKGIKGFTGILNADVNASYNIMRKVIPNCFRDGIEGVVVHPIVQAIKR